jgi:hypothetical protein
MKTRVLAALLLLAGCVAGAGPTGFNRDVRPILSDKCFTCHGPDAAAKKVPLRLDSEAAAKAVIEPGDPEHSRLMQRVRAAKPALRMPPVHSGLTLSEADIATLEAWIREGAKWEKHWSFIPPVRQPVPDGIHPIDYFVRRQLERAGLKPSPEAGRETLIRRVTLDLTGLPPTPAEVDAFVNDKSPNAYEKLVDRLLASPRYGERMAVRWLDAARYADTNGYQFDGERVMWRWRDWVIESFNRNQPYDRFTVEQIAGDLLPHATLDQKIATGFNRNHRANTEDGIIPEEYAVEYVVDRVETTSTVFLGLTLGCARCHNHKYDPFTQKDFYRMFAYFNNVPELGRAMKYGNSPPVVPAPTREQQAKHEALLEALRSERQTLSKFHTPERVAADARWFPSTGLVASFPGAAYDGTRVTDGGRAGNFDIDDRWSLVAVITPETADGSIMSRMADKLKGKGYGVHLDHGKVHVNLTSNYNDDAIRVETEQTIEAGTTHHIAVTYDGSVAASGVRVYIDGQPAKLKVLLDTLYRPFSNAGRQFGEPFRIGSGWGSGRRFKGRIDEVRIYDRVLPAVEIAGMALPETVGQISAKASASRSEAERNVLRWYWLEHDADSAAREAYKRYLSLDRERELLERTFPTVMVMAENPTPKPAHVLIRGAYDKPGERVDRGVPEVLPPLPPGATNDRLGLAKWIVDPANPLTARVAVNRFWQGYFGAGLVRTPEDFGTQGDAPSQPDLLDWLATEFVRSGWDVKAMQKLIVTSATYRQESKLSPELLAKDPDNRLLARGPRHRLSPEMVRDQALFTAGLLTEKLGGPSVKPYQPEGLWKEQAMQDMDYVQTRGPDLYRRSLYTFWKRTIPPPMMVNFDAANREACVVRETRTNTPLQSLNLMNDVTFVEAARFLGQRMMKEGGPDAASRLRYGFRLVLSRAPSPEELRLLQSNLAFHRDYFASDAARATALLRQGDSRADDSLPPAELAAYASVASLMLNLDEAVTKD